VYILLTSASSFGLEPVAFHRTELVHTLLDGLPKNARDKYLVGHKVVNIATGDTGVVVSCTNGKSFTGSMVLGADGVHSQTRKIMHNLSSEDRFSASRNPEPPFSAHYRCLWSNCPRPCEAGKGNNTQAKDRSIMWITGRERAWLFLYEKLPQPTQEPTQYTKAEMDEFAASFAEWPVDENLKVKDVYDSSTAGMSNLEEGILEHWSLGRIVLAGDACHKFTPNAGLGLTNGIQDVTLLCNLLHNVTKSNADSDISADALQQIFREYESSRREPTAFDYGVSAAATRSHAWATPIYWFIGRFLYPVYAFQWFLQRYVLAPRMKQSRVLDYVFGEDRIQGRIPWAYPIPRKGK
jgi:2-polyprenyl-6-methoxyphenol hydroxylase-like FAD-dependent oxidoreductase